MATKRAPAGKKKLVTVHVDGVHLTPGYVDFLSMALSAAATRWQSDGDRRQPGDPLMQTNAAGDLVVYVDTRSV